MKSVILNQSSSDDREVKAVAKTEARNELIVVIVGVEFVSATPPDFILNHFANSFEAV